MSSPDSATSAKPPERVGCVLGIALGLLCLGSLVWFIVLPKAEPRDGVQLLRDWFALEAPPEGLEIGNAGKLMGGEEVLQLRATRAEPEAAKPAAPSSSPQEPPRDWGALPEGPKDREPRHWMFVTYPANGGRSRVQGLFRADLAPGRPDEVGSRGGRMIREVGTIDWHGAPAAFVLEREFEAGGSFRDLVRVDLSRNDRWRIAHVTWSRGEPFSKPRLIEGLARFPAR